MSLSLPPQIEQTSKVFLTLEAFNEGYAGPDTKLLEIKSRELAGKQDDFCIICGSQADELFPQTAPGEIHQCPRQLCKSCWHIEAGWKRDSLTKRRNLNIDKGWMHLVVCCPLCWKRGWDFSSPLLGPDQPEWSARSDIEPPVKDDILALRRKNWEDAARTKIFSWRKPLLTYRDDMTLESDRNLLRGMLKKFQKNPKRFKMFDGQSVVEASLEDTKFDPKSAFNDHWKHLVELVSSQKADKDVAGDATSAVKRGPGRPRKKGRAPGWYMVAEPIEPAEGTHNTSTELVEKSQTPDTGGRPKRQAARLSFASGIPVQNPIADASGGQGNDIVASRSLRTRGSKIVVLPVSLPGSPEMKKGMAEFTPDSGRRSTSHSHNKALPSTEFITQSTAMNDLRREYPPYGEPNGIFRDELGEARPLLADYSNIQEEPANESILRDAIVSQVGDDDISGARPDYLNARLLDLQSKNTALQQEYDLLGTKYRRWRSGVVENAKLLFEQEEDLIAKKDLITELNKTVKQLSSDNARLGAELALARGMVQYNPGLLKQTLLRSSLTPDVVERLFSNPDFIQLLQPRPANGEVGPLQHPPQHIQQSQQNTDLARPKKRRRITAADALNDAEAEEARQKKLSRVIAPTIKRLEKSRFKLSAAKIESVFDADTAESKRFLDSLIDFAKLPIDFEEAFVLIREAQQDRKQGRVVVPQLRLSDPAWAPWDVKTAQKRYMQREGMIENENGEIITKKPKSMEEMVADAKAVREAASKRQSIMELNETTLSDDESLGPTTDEARNASASRRGGRSESQTRRVWERHEELRREREQREQEEQRAAMPPLDMTDPLQALAASMFTSMNGSGSRGKGRASAMNGSRRSGSPKHYQRREPSEDVEMEEHDEPMELSESP